VLLAAGAGGGPGLWELDPGPRLEVESPLSVFLGVLFMVRQFCVFLSWGVFPSQPGEPGLLLRLRPWCETIFRGIWGS
jgi:hypothetical protein